MLAEGGETDATRITFAFRLVTTRIPTAAELKLLVGALADYRRDLQHEVKSEPSSEQESDSSSSAPSTVSAASNVELAAVTALANVLLNLEEVTTRE
jgi:hypothetical protein